MFQCIPSVKRTDYMQTWAFLMHGTCQTSIEDKNHCQIVWSLSLFFSIEIYAPTSHTQKCFFPGNKFEDGRCYCFCEVTATCHGVTGLKSMTYFPWKTCFQENNHTLDPVVWFHL